MLLANFNGKEHLRHRAVSLRQHGFLVLNYLYVLFWSTTVCGSRYPILLPIHRFHLHEGPSWSPEWSFPVHTCRRSPSPVFSACVVVAANYALTSRNLARIDYGLAMLAVLDQQQTLQNNTRWTIFNNRYTCLCINSHGKVLQIRLVCSTLGEEGGLGRCAWNEYKNYCIV